MQNAARRASLAAPRARGQRMALARARGVWWNLRPMRSPLYAALATAVLAAATPAVAAPRLHGVPAHVRGGSELRVTWSGLGPEAHEAELELSLAGGRWVRISPELDAHEGGFRWRVPTGLTGQARLRLRFGGEAFEAEGDVSAPFVIDAVAASRAADADMDEWGDLGRSHGNVASAHVTGAPSLQPRGPSLALSPEPDRIARLAASFSGHTPVRTPNTARRDVVERRGSLARCYPLRI